MNKKLGLLAIPVVAGLGVLSVAALNPSAHAAPMTTQSTTSSQESTTAEAPDTTEAKDSTKADNPNGPNVEQTGQNETNN